jgi:hypothetical protein
MNFKNLIIIASMLTSTTAWASPIDLNQEAGMPTAYERTTQQTQVTTYGEAPKSQSGIVLAGPRIGLVYLMGDLPERLKKGGIPVLTQIGWQFENYFFQDESGWTGISEYVLMVAGMERELLLPSASWLVGIRSPTGVEFGIGPTVSMASMARGISNDEFSAENISGLGAVLAAGMTFKAGRVNFPVNVAFVKSGESNRFVLSCGFNLQES